MTPAHPLPDLHARDGAALAGDGIPLHYGDRRGEYETALSAAVLMDRSHEGRLRLDGRDRLAIPHRLSTNALEALPDGGCAPTIFTNPNARILDRVTVCRRGEAALMLTEPGRGEAVTAHLRRSIFFNDDLRLSDLRPAARQFVLIGPRAAAVMAQLGAAVDPLTACDLTLAGTVVTVLRDKSLGGDPAGDLWRLIVPEAAAAQVWTAVRAVGAHEGLRPAGSLTYHALRVRAGRPGVGAELSVEYLPLEVGLWDEISFTKGCYVGQEIIARMESRRRLARTIVRVRLEGVADAPATPAALRVEGREVGKLTSAVVTPRGDSLGIAIVRLAHAVPGAALQIGESGASAHILDRAGVQPDLQAEG
ncbi:MAG: folate-binding protein YgfZ [Anaerolineae bacterium]|nr:folate-binding protein YgfZ [Anaerolineae bacterium]